MNILVFGKDGQLGKAFQGVFLANKLGELHHIRYVGRAQCDLGDEHALTALLQKFKPFLIINAAAYTAVDQAETEVELAYAINAKAPAIMARYALEEGATLLHYSTDYVFDGSKVTPYLESDVRNPLGIYGKSKVAGEVAVEQPDDRGDEPTPVRMHLELDGLALAQQFRRVRHIRIVSRGCARAQPDVVMSRDQGRAASALRSQERDIAGREQVLDSLRVGQNELARGSQPTGPAHDHSITHVRLHVVMKCGGQGGVGIAHIDPRCPLPVGLRDGHQHLDERFRAIHRVPRGAQRRSALG